MAPYAILTWRGRENYAELEILTKKDDDDDDEEEEEEWV